MNLETAEYIRVGTSYYAIVERPTISNSTEKIMLPWSKETITNDLGKEFLLKVKKFFSFICIPNHLSYNREVKNFYNIYHPLDYKIDTKSEFDLKELEQRLKYTFIHLRHIFGNDQFHLVLDYIKILLEKPTQILPILALVSNERETGKSLFLKYLRKIFSFNATYTFAETFLNNFNADTYGKLLL